MANPNTTIQFDDDVDQIRRTRSRDPATTTGTDFNDGIVSGYLTCKSEAWAMTDT